MNFFTLLFRDSSKRLYVPNVFTSKSLAGSSIDTFFLAAALWNIISTPSKYLEIDSVSVMSHLIDLKLSKFNKIFNNLIPKGNYETLAGYIISEIGRIPNQGENLFLSIGQVLIKKSSSRRIEEIQIYPNK